MEAAVNASPDNSSIGCLHFNLTTRLWEDLKVGSQPPTAPKPWPQPESSLRLGKRSSKLG